jgi:serine protease Do
MNSARLIMIGTMSFGLGLGALLHRTARAEGGRGAAADGPSQATSPPSGGALAPQKDPERYTPVVQAVERVRPAVVSITTTTPVTDPFTRFATGATTASTEGSGVVIDTRGIVLTNNHVVERATRITASFDDGRSYEADVLGLSAELDLAVLQLKLPEGTPSTLVAAPLGRSSDLMLGEPVIAMGNPFGLGLTVTTGVLSSTSRQIETAGRIYQDFLQTDASINPGNSGGPLLDVHGNLIGINTAIRADAQGIGFAIPVDRAIKIAHDLAEFGAVRVPWLGVDLSEVVVRTPSGKRGRTVVVRVDRVWADGPLQVGDLIGAVDGRSVQGRSDLNAYLSAYKPGRTVVIAATRSDTALDLDVRTSDLPDRVVNTSLREVLGVEVEQTGRTSSPAGVRVRDLTTDGSFARAGLRKGDEITAVNGRAVESTDDLKRLLAGLKSSHRGTALLTVRRGDATGRVNVAI